MPIKTGINIYLIAIKYLLISRYLMHLNWTNLISFLPKIVYAMELSQELCRKGLLFFTNVVLLLIITFHPERAWSFVLQKWIPWSQTFLLNMLEFGLLLLEKTISRFWQCIFQNYYLVLFVKNWISLAKEGFARVYLK